MSDSLYPTVGLIVSHLPFGPTAYFTLCNVVMRHDIPDLGTMSEAKPHLITHGFTSRLGKRVSTGALGWGRGVRIRPATCDCPFLCPRCLISFVIYSLCPKTTAIGSSPLPTRMTTFPSGGSLGCIWDPMIFIAFWLTHSPTKAHPYLCLLSPQAPCLQEDRPPQCGAD